MEITRRFANKNKVAIKKRMDGGQMITGYGAVFYNASDPGTEFELWQNTVERIMPGAFDRAISEGHDVRGLSNHSPDNILGRTSAGTMRLSVDSIGLRYEIDVADTQQGKDLLTSIERGDISGSSFAFIPTRTVWIEDGDMSIRQIEDVDLIDVGPVTYPAYEASTTGVRSGDSDSLKKEYDAFQAEKKNRDAVGVRSRIIAIDNE